MLTAPPTDSKKTDTSSPTLAALKCAYSLMQQRIISNPNDMMGVLLYGTEKTKFQSGEQSSGSLAYPHCYLLTDLDIPAPGDVKALKALANVEEDHEELLKPSEEPVAMANVLFCANQLFTTKAPNFSSRRVFIITDDDDPHKHEKTMKSSAAVRAKDLYDLGVTIELFPISKPGHEFDRRKFYDVCKSYSVSVCIKQLKFLRILSTMPHHQIQKHLHQSREQRPRLQQRMGYLC